jgi:antitoxin FitA
VLVALFWRYDEGMATIQIRDIPDEVYENIRRRAGEAGQSLQAYMRQHVVDWGSRRSKAEMMAELRKVVAADPGPGVTIEDVLADLDADRR